MWHFQNESLSDRVHRYRLLRDSEPLQVAEAWAKWRHDEEFRTFFIELLAASPFSAFRWETPPVTQGLVDMPFEFVLINQEQLDRPVDPAAFADHFDNSPVVAFPNLGRDALMIVPCPVADVSVYGHLASFIRGAPTEQLHCFWQCVGDQMQQRLAEQPDQPIWLNTAGMGVSWLHVRLDSRPKYYFHTPYKSIPNS